MSKRPRIKIINHTGARDAFNLAEATASLKRRTLLNNALIQIETASGQLPSKVVMDDQIEEARRSLRRLKTVVDKAVEIANSGLY